MRNQSARRWFSLTLVVAAIATAIFGVRRREQSPFVSGAVRSLRIPPKSLGLFQERINRCYANRNYPLWMNRLALLRATIERLAKERGIDPEFILGLIVQESQGNPLAIDNVFLSGHDKRTHIGLGQLAKGYMPVSAQNDRERTKLAFLYRQIYRRLTPGGRRLFINRWAKVDPRFDALKNLEVTLDTFIANLKICGEETLALMAHHGGMWDPPRRVARYRYDQMNRRYPTDLDRNFAWLRRETAPYVRRHGLNFFVLFEDRGLQGSTYWAKKRDDHVNYAQSVLAWTELAVRWEVSPDEYRPKAEDNNRPGEVAFDVARAIEHTLWYPGRPKYQTVEDLRQAAALGILVPAPRWLKANGFRLAANTGHLAGANQRYVKMMTKEIAGMLREAGRRIRAQLGYVPNFRLDSAVRYVDYPLGQGAKDSSHNFGGAVDIDLNTSGLRYVEKQVLFRELYAMSQEGKLTYYMEADAAIRGVIPIFPVPYNFAQGGQVHVVVNPEFKAYFTEVYGRRQSGSVSKAVALVLLLALIWTVGGLIVVALYVLSNQEMREARRQKRYQQVVRRSLMLFSVWPFRLKELRPRQKE